MGLISLGYHERNDVLGAVDYIRRRYQDSADRPEIVLMGVSMGAAATLEAAAESKDYAAIILDSPFSSIRETVTRHCWLLLRLPKYPFTPLFLFWFERLARFDPERVNSHRAMGRCQPVPLLVIASEGDVRMGAATARELLGESRSPVKQLKVFGRDVGHGSAARIHPEAYAALLLQFAEGSLRAPVSIADSDEAIIGSSAAAGSPR
jgi:pimeloyl-ACP methyl ester carboxylesterase